MATDYGIPQTRNRCFMISILGDYSYTFPQPIPLKLKLKDMLEDNVDEKYYLSDKQIKDVQGWNAYEKPFENMEKTDKSNISPTLDTRCDCLGVCVGTYQYAKSDNFMQGKDRLQLGKEVSDTLQTTQKEAIVYNNLRIRKLTPKECFRLMGVKDEDFENCAKNQSDASLYHLAGDSIVVNVLMSIFKELL
jgi:DNA (cytosine-5)-methyltransferase 1